MDGPELADMYDYDEGGTLPTSESSQLEIMIKCAVAGLVGVFCVVGNLLVIRTLLFFKHPKIPIYIVIGGLAIADLLTAVVEIPNFVMQWTTEEAITEEWCSAINYLTTSCKYIAACHIGVLSIIRCIMLNDRHHSKSYVVHAFVTSLLLWILVILVNLPSVINSSVEKNNVMHSDIFPKGCVQNEGLNKVAERNTWLRISFSFIFPMFVTMVVYIVTWYFTQRYFQDSYSRGERRLSRMVTLIVITFVIFKLPVQIVDMMIFYSSKSLYDALMEGITNIDDPMVFRSIIDTGYNNLKTLINVKYICECVALLDLAIRPIIYAKLSYYFRKSFDEVLNCTSCKKNSVPSRRNIRRKRNGPSQTPLTEENELDESPETEHIQTVDRIEAADINVNVTVVEISSTKE